MQFYLVSTMEAKFAVLKMCWMLGLADAGGTVGLLFCFFLWTYTIHAQPKLVGTSGERHIKTAP